jgi:hypothetical protein
VPIEKTHRIESIPLSVTKKPGSFVAVLPGRAAACKLGRKRQRTKRQLSAAISRKFPARFAALFAFPHGTVGFRAVFRGTRLAERRGMKRFVTIGALAAATIWAAVSPAQAELFSLNGRFQCLESGAKVCGDAQIVVKPLPPPAARPAAVEPVLADPVLPLAIAVPAPTITPPANATAAATPPIDPMKVVAARIQARRPTANDIAWLTKQSQNGDVRAIELLAWCKLNAIGMARDPIQAYLLYGAAGNAAVPNARDNQRLIYERDLTSDQRQQVLNLANEGMALARIVPTAH